MYEPGAISYTYWSIRDGQAEAVAGGVIDETLLSLYVNGQELATMMCSPVDCEALALGFLFNEGVIVSLADVSLIRANVPRTTIDVFLTHANFAPPRRLTLTSGCGGGISFQNLAHDYPPVESDLVITPQIVLDRMHDLNHCAGLYREVRGVHAAILSDADGPLLCAEDIGRHNTIDKLAGKALLDGIETRDLMLVSSGRISSEMLSKARQMGIPIVASRTAPTSISVQLAQSWNICVVGYVRQNGMRVYTHPQRVGLPEITDR
ncbi:MAG: formate dehydrogenase accessory sulfurtransferase FdhD [Anaerolineae bacterium]|nr:formate dehydrogenase accessory sulfurtransferase FdhD [Anaerolineae bacterium]